MTVTISEGLDFTISGPDYVTVGVPSSVECTSSCFSCTYSMSLDGQSAQGQGNVLAFTVNNWIETLTVTCTLTDDTSQKTTTTTKQIQVLGKDFFKKILLKHCEDIGK